MFFWVLLSFLPLLYFYSYYHCELFSEFPTGFTYACASFFCFSFISCLFALFLSHFPFYCSTYFLFVFYEIPSGMLISNPPLLAYLHISFFFLFCVAVFSSRNLSRSFLFSERLDWVNSQNILAYLYLFLSWFAFLFVYFRISAKSWFLYLFLGFQWISVLLFAQSCFSLLFFVLFFIFRMFVRFCLLSFLLFDLFVFLKMAFFIPFLFFFSSSFFCITFELNFIWSDEITFFFSRHCFSSFTFSDHFFLPKDKKVLPKSLQNVKFIFCVWFIHKLSFYFFVFAFSFLFLFQFASFFLFIFSDFPFFIVFVFFIILIYVFLFLFLFSFLNYLFFIQIIFMKPAILIFI